MTLETIPQSQTEIEAFTKSQPECTGVNHLFDDALRARRLTIFHAALEAGCTPAVMNMLALGASPMIKCSRGWLPIHYFAASNPSCPEIKAVSKVLDGINFQGAIDSLTEGGDSPIHLACDTTSSPHVLTELLRLEPDLSVKDSNQRTPFERALSSGRLDLASILVPFCLHFQELQPSLASVTCWAVEAKRRLKKWWKAAKASPEQRHKTEHASSTSSLRFILPPDGGGGEDGGGRRRSPVPSKEGRRSRANERKVSHSFTKGTPNSPCLLKRERKLSSPSFSTTKRRGTPKKRTGSLIKVRASCLPPERSSVSPSLSQEFFSSEASSSAPLLPMSPELQERRKQRVAPQDISNILPYGSEGSITTETNRPLIKSQSAITIKKQPVTTSQLSLAFLPAMDKEERRGRSFKRWKGKGGSQLSSASAILSSASSFPSSPSLSPATSPPPDAGHITIELSGQTIVFGSAMGTGGLGGIVYQCWVHGWECACKTINTSFHGPPEIAGFLREASLCTSLPQHPNLVRYLFHSSISFKGESLMGLFMMKYSGTLRQDLDALKEEGDRLSPETALQIATQIATGIKMLHRRNILHRDINPGNIMIIRDKDNAICKCALGDLGEAVALPSTEPLRPAGTVGFMAPEVLQSKEGGAYGLSADIYSFGMLLYQLLELKQPFEHINWLLIDSQVASGRTLSLSPDSQLRYPILNDVFVLCSSFSQFERPTIQRTLMLLQNVGTARTV